VVANGRLYLTGHDGEKRLTLCVDAGKGALLWQREVVRTRAEPFNPTHGPTTPTPAADAAGVVVFFPEVGLISYSRDGEERWRMPLGPFSSVQGLAASPVLAGSNVILQVDQTRESWLAAFDASTGKQQWKIDRPSNFLGAYSTPVVHEGLVISAGAFELAAFRVSSGEKVWSARGLTYAPATTPVIHGDTVMIMEPVGGDEGAAPPFEKMLSPEITVDGKIAVAKVKDGVMNRLYAEMDRQEGNGDGFVDRSEWSKSFQSSKGFGGLSLTQLGGSGDVSKSNVKWRASRSYSYVTSPVLYRGVIYIVNNGGIVTTVNPENGEVFQQARLPEALGAYYASPVAGDGKIFFASEPGKITVVKAGPKWEKLATNDLGESIMATPAISDGRLYVRTREALYCFRAGG
jgi:outer membrane protein assembly factor BamB